MTHRCFICGARMWAATERGLLFASGRRRRFRFACGSCGVLVDDPARGFDCRPHLDIRLAGSSFESDEGAPYGLDIHTLRTAATGLLLAVEPADAGQAAALRAPHGAVAARGRLVPLAPVGDPCISLGILCRPDDLDAVLSGLPDLGRWTDDIVVMVDAERVRPRALPGGRIVARRLSKDFAEQRNALQTLAAKPWMLQLDADEAIDPETAALLAALACMAERDGATSIGLPRRNLVEGVLSDLFPDVQYRLNHREVRYAGRVHERPNRPWRRSFIALHGAIEHRLSRAHVRARSRRYEAMEPGRGRPEEAEALLRAYRP